MELADNICGARHPVYTNIRCLRTMDDHPSWHETRMPDGAEIVWALEAIHSNVQRRWLPGSLAGSNLGVPRP